ncbi:hypothetical protein [Nocardioides sp.]|uniref:hypothetical protein n=1 Tax=Nocardioides sp. TaxID=35761 RepID=UPI00199A5BDD|nr:hypothetical protein [Nocardioides sp.]MBC7279202.1 hypothetical protein [Nocardioides sp.]
MEWLTESLSLGEHLVQWGVCVPIAAGFAVGIVRMAVRGQREGRVIAERGTQVAKVVPFPRPATSEAPGSPWGDTEVSHANLRGVGSRCGKSVKVAGDGDQLAVVLRLPSAGLEGTERGGWFA